MISQDFYLGLDIGTDSVGYAATDLEYRLLKYKGEPAWGTHLFEAAKLSDERRANRTARRRLDRRQMRVKLIQELFAKAIYEVDPHFFIRIQQSSLLSSEAGDAFIFFQDDGYTDREYFKQYPTIHHLLLELMESTQPHDVRLVYLACAWLVAHRGHFLSAIDQSNIEEVRDITGVYQALMNYFATDDLTGGVLPWEACDKALLGNILKEHSGVTTKEKKLVQLLFEGKKPKDTAGEENSYPYNRSQIVKLLAGGKADATKLFGKEEYKEIEKKSFSLGMADEDFELLYNELGDDSELIRRLKAIYDWAILNDVLEGSRNISEAKVREHTQHKQDLRQLKDFIRKYVPVSYNKIFRNAGTNNYVAYSYHTQDCKGTIQKKASQEAFCDYIRKIVEKVEPEAEDQAFYEDMMERLANHRFMPKQVNTDNRVIPYQLYRNELEKILRNAAQYLPFLNEKDQDGYTVQKKIMSVFDFRMPYYVGPLCKYQSKNAWIVRKAEGKIYPWNFTQMVDLDASEAAFISRMTNTCSYCPGESVLPKSSVLYAAFMVLNEINNIKIGAQKISVEGKQRIFSELFMKKRRVTVKDIHNFLISNGILTKEELPQLSGLDETIQSSMAPALDFKKLKESGTLTNDEIERIILRITCTEDAARLRKWLKENYPQLSQEDRTYISKLKYKDFGRLSKKLLCGIYGTDQKAETGEAMTVMEALWRTNYNFMELLSDRFTYAAELHEMRHDYYQEHPQTLSQRLGEMWISNGVKRPIIRTLDIVDDVVKSLGRAPKKIFVEMARGADAAQKGKRTRTRKQQLEALYQLVKNEDSHRMQEQLAAMGEMADNRLQSDKLFLYYLQLGKCMYTGTPIDLEKLKDGTYNIEHIYPQCYVKDDSIWNNEVLVLSEVNGQKSDTYPISADIQNRMRRWWEYLHQIHLITDEKFKRLIRTTRFSAEERMGFINRQLVETRQSTKAVTTLLKEKYPDAEIVYVKAGLVSDFRQQFKMLKSRQVNDLHHAKDAYLNIVTGNVYHEKFTRRWFDVNKPYSIKTEALFGHTVEAGGRVIWQGNASVAQVKKTMQKNAVHYTRYAFCRSGGLFDQLPVKAAPGLIPLKKGKPTELYGGYNKPTAAFFALVKYRAGKKQDAMIMPVELCISESFVNDQAFALQYAKKTVSAIRNKAVDQVEFPLGKRILKVNTMLSLDGFRCCITGKAGGGKCIILMPMMPLTVERSMEEYIKAIESFSKKATENAQLQYDENHSKINREMNMKLYDCLVDKLEHSIYIKRPNHPLVTLKNGRDAFKGLSVSEQVKCLMQVLQVFGRMTGGCNLKSIDGVEHAAATVSFSSTISNWKKNYQDVRIIDSSASGLHETKSQNLLELI